MGKIAKPCRVCTHICWLLVHVVGRSIFGRAVRKDATERGRAVREGGRSILDASNGGVSRTSAALFSPIVQCAVGAFSRRANRPLLPRIVC